MMISTFELGGLFPDRDFSTITTEELIETLKKQDNITKKTESSEFKTSKKVGIVTDEWGQEHIGIIKTTGFENEGF